jgi:glycosyltransferase involved in cell wall biosynthesis
MAGDSKNVVFVSETMPLGGTSTFAVNVCEGMRQAGDWRGVAAVMRKLGEVGEQMRSRQLPLISPAKDAVLHEERIEHLYRECARYSPHAVVAALSSGSFEFLRYVPPGCIRVGMIQSDEAQVYDLVERFLPWLDAVAGVSTEICRKIEARMTSRKIPAVHQPYGVPMPEAPPARSHDGPLRVLYLGRVSEEQKRVSLMSRVMKATLAQHPTLTWTLAGDGPDLPAFQEEFDGDARVKILGSVPYEQVPKLLEAHDVYFLCSDYEGLPLSLLEAMGAGLVPVVSDLPSGISEVVNDRNGIRVAIDDEKAYADAVLQLAENAERLTAMSAAASSAVRLSHSTLAMANRWQTMLDGMIGSQAPDWSRGCRAGPPLGYEKRLLFNPLFRPLRSAVKRFRQGKANSIGAT